MPRTLPINPRFRRIFQSLSGADLAAPDPAELSLEDLGLGDSQQIRGGLLFGTYSHQGLERGLRAYGLLQRAEERVGPMELRIQGEDPFRPRIVLWSRRFYAPVADISLRMATGAEVGLGGPLTTVPLLYVDALLLQNPGRSFDWHRPPLPGQSHPGLALSAPLLELLMLMARRIGAEGLALTPSTYAAATVYDRRFLFVDGEAQGRFLALRDAGDARPRWLVAWAVELGCMRDAEGQHVPFTPMPMLAPFSPRLRDAFEMKEWLEGREKTGRRLLTLDEEALRQRFPWERMPPGPPPERFADLLGYDPLAPVLAH